MCCTIVLPGRPQGYCRQDYIASTTTSEETFRSLGHSRNGSLLLQLVAAPRMQAGSRMFEPRKNATGATCPWCFETLTNHSRLVYFPLAGATWCRLEKIPTLIQITNHFAPRTLQSMSFAPSLGDELRDKTPAPAFEILSHKVASDAGNTLAISMHIKVPIYLLAADPHGSIPSFATPLSTQCSYRVAHFDFPMRPLRSRNRNYDSIPESESAENPSQRGIHRDMPENGGQAAISSSTVYRNLVDARGFESGWPS